MLRLPRISGRRTSAWSVSVWRSVIDRTAASSQRGGMSEDIEPLKVCRMCLKHRKLIRAHIVPKGFYKPIMSKKGVVILSPTEKNFEQPTQSGIFDKNILCAECDARLGKLDEYGLSIFGKAPGKADLIEGRLLPGYDLHCKDVPKAQKFLLSVLWRASISEHSFFYITDLGEKYEEKIRLLLLCEEPVREEDFEFTVTRLEGSPLAGAFMPPFAARTPEGINCYRLFLPFFSFMVRMDRRPFPPLLKLIRFTAASTPQCIKLNYAGSVEEKIFSKVTNDTLKRAYSECP